MAGTCSGLVRKVRITSRLMIRVATISILLPPEDMFWLVFPILKVALDEFYRWVVLIFHICCPLFNVHLSFVCEFHVWLDAFELAFLLVDDVRNRQSPRLRERLKVAESTDLTREIRVHRMKIVSH